MKKVIVCITFISATMYSLQSNAQLLKSILNRAAVAIKQSHYVKDSSVLIKPKIGSLSAALKKMSADTVGMTGNYAKQQRISVSPADSAAAINNFRKGSGGRGILYQYLSTTSFEIRGKSITDSDTMSMSITDNYNTRTDFGTTSTLKYAAIPRYTMMLTPQDKTYLLTIIDTANMGGSDKLNYTVTKIGNENVQGYNCIHAKLTIATTKNREITEDVWVSKDVPGFLNLKKRAALQNVTPKMLQAMDQAGCDGFFVKIAIQSPSYNMNMFLITAKRENFPASMFQIPAGYIPAKFGNIPAQFMHL